MNFEKQFGLYLYKKESQDSKVLKDLLQFLKTNSRGSSHSFSYIEAETSLHPHISLFDNLQIELGPSNWKDFHQTLKPEFASLVNLLKNPEMMTKDAEDWEKFIVSLIKGLMTPTQNLLIDMNENVLSPFMIQNLKKSILGSTKDKTVYLASANSSLWLDCAHTVVDRKEYKFEVQKFDSENIRKYWVA